MRLPVLVGLAVFIVSALLFVIAYSKQRVINSFGDKMPTPRAKTQWGIWFIEILEQSYETKRLDRGWSYAKNGKVKSLHIDNNTVTAKVHGTYTYTVTLVFPPLSEHEKQTIQQIIEKNPIILSEIKAGRLPDTFAQALKKHKLNLIPQKWRSIKTSCTCPDWGDPCKHRAAVLYVLTEYFDNNPAVLFTLRGFQITDYFARADGEQNDTASPAKLPDNIFGSLTYSSKRPALQADDEPHVIPSAQYTGIIQALLPPTPPWAPADFTSTFMLLYHKAKADAHVFLDENEELFNKYVNKLYQTDFSALELSTGALLLKDNLPAKEFRERWFSSLQWKAVQTKNHHEYFCYFLAQDFAGNNYFCTIGEAVKHLLECSSSQGTPSYRFLFYFARMIRSFWKAGAFIPATGIHKRNLYIYWTPFTAMPEVKRCMANLAVLEPYLFKKGTKTLSAESSCFLLSAQAITELVRAQPLPEDIKTKNAETVRKLFYNSALLNCSTPKTSHIPDAIRKWTAPFYLNFEQYKYRFVITDLRSLKTQTAQAHDDSSQAAKNENESIPLSLELALSVEVELNNKYILLSKAVAKTKNYELLTVPHALSNYIPELLELGNKPAVFIEERRLGDFFDEAFPLLAELGMEVVLPKKIHKAVKPKLVLQAEIDPYQKNLVTYASLEAVTDFSWKIALGDMVISVEEFENLLNAESRIVQFKNRFLILSLDDASALLLKAKAQQKPGTQEVLQEYFTGNLIDNGGFAEKLSNLLQEVDVKIPASIQAQLRPYQERGYRWAYSLLRSGFGCIIADDMGLGKTLQAITVLAQLKEEGRLEHQGALVIAPAALLTNWEAEFAKFAPHLTVLRQHGTARDFSKQADVFLTTYQTAVRDKKILLERCFSALIVDEAHIMKNPETAISKTVKAIPAVYKLALSGTPVENKLEDLRSLFDFILPGYLGTREDFFYSYRIPIEMDRSIPHANHLKRITAPFILRRLKTDKHIINDLPEKIEIDEYAQLVPKQAALYNAAVEDALVRAGNAKTPFEQAGIVLQLILQVKQICDHPRVFDKLSDPLAELSGKAQLLIELLYTILQNNEKVLIFSQYVETLQVLETIIEKELAEHALLYHGSLSAKERDSVITEFQTGCARIMLTSLKAGGLGLNLTAASRVIHYDLWFNPAVEMQATDRAYRIGQKNNVFVHRFITKNTFEERINEMLKNKKELAAMTVNEGESWIAKLSKEELREIFAMR